MQVHVQPERRRRIAAREPAGCDQDVVHGVDILAAELLRDRCDEIAGLLQQPERSACG